MSTKKIPALALRTVTAETLRSQRLRREEANLFTPFNATREGAVAQTRQREREKKTRASTGGGHPPAISRGVKILAATSDIGTARYQQQPPISDNALLG